MNERIEKIEVGLALLIDTMLREDTEQDGNWGYTSYLSELRDLQKQFPLKEADQ